MYCTGRMQVDGFDYPIMRCKISIPGPKINQVGTVLAPPPAPSFTIKIESRQETNLFRWLSEIQIKSHVKLQFSSVNMDGQSKTFDLYDVRCISNQESFSFDGDAPMANTLTLVPAILVAEGVLLRVQNWKIQDPAVIMGQVEPKEITQAEEDTESKVKNQYITDIEDNENASYKMGDHIYVVIESQNMIGEEIDIKIPDKKVDFLHEGKRLKDDMLKNYVISNDIEKIPLQVIPEDHKDL